MQIRWERREGEWWKGKKRESNEKGPDLHFTWFLNGWLINRVSKTRFLGRRHMEKMAHHTWSNHGNRVFGTRFIGLNQVLETRDVSIIYSLKTVPTNYIVWQTVLISNFGPTQLVVTTNPPTTITPVATVLRWSGLTTALHNWSHIFFPRRWTPMCLATSPSLLLPAHSAENAHACISDSQYLL